MTVFQENKKKRVANKKSHKRCCLLFYLRTSQKKVNDDNIMMIYDFLFSELLVRGFNIWYIIIITILANALQSFHIWNKNKSARNN